MFQKFILTRLNRLPDVAQAMQVLEGDVARDRRWWIDDHFRIESDATAGGLVLVPAITFGPADDLDGATLVSLLTPMGIMAEQRVTIWWSTDDGSMATLPLHLVAAHLNTIWYPNEDIFLCHPPDDWGLFLYHEGLFSVGRADPTFVRLVGAAECSGRDQWRPPDDQVPSTARQSELRAGMTDNQSAGRPSCMGVQIRTRGELQWVVGQNVDRSQGDRLTPPSTSLPQARADLRGAILQGANLEGLRLMGAYLDEADLSGSNLTGAYLQLARLRGANLTAATLYRAHCYRADFGDAILRGACLNRAYLRRAALAGTDFFGAQLVGTVVIPEAVSSIASTAPDVSRLWIVA